MKSQVELKRQDSKRKQSSDLRDLIASEAGQATVEYALLVFFTVTVAFLAAVGTLEVAVLDYYQDVASLICLPIP